MVISVNHDANHLSLLLYIRSAWGIATDADVPALDPAPNPGASHRPETQSMDEWGSRWHQAWDRAWAWYEIEDMRNQRPTSELLRALSRPGQALHPAFPPNWSSEYGLDGVDMDAFNRWSESLHPNPMFQLEQSPERRCLPRLIEAWRTGLDTIVVMPYEGYFAQRITRRHLVVSAATRDDPASFNRALSTTH